MGVGVEGDESHRQEQARSEYTQQTFLYSKSGINFSHGYYFFQNTTKGYGGETQEASRGEGDEPHRQSHTKYSSNFPVRHIWN